MVWCLSFLFHISFVMTGIYIFFSKFVTLTLVLLNFTDQLGILWLAGTMGKGNNAWRRLSKGRILESNIVQLSGQIVEPKRQLALRTTATLLLGIVVIYQRKFQYLVGEWSYWNLWNCGFVVNIYKKNYFISCQRRWQLKATRWWASSVHSNWIWTLMRESICQRGKWQGKRTKYFFRFENKANWPTDWILFPVDSRA